MNVSPAIINRSYANNFDFLRLLFATLVLITHAYPLSGVAEEDMLFKFSNGQTLFSTFAVLGFLLLVVI